MAENRDQWGSKIGLILAMAGNAVGLGNFWRFPYIAATNGGGAFMIPYFFALIVIGIPIMLVEWSIGRYGGAHGHGTVGPMIYLQAKKAVKPKTAIILGALAGAIAFGVTLLVNSYYTHIIGWSLGYAVESLLGGYVGVDGTTFFVNYITDPKMLIFWVISLALLGWAVMKGVSEGIEAWAKVMMPAIYVFGIILAVRAVTLGAPVNPDWSSMKGLNFVWNPDLSQLTSASIVTATGQIFFTLSLGMGIICNYASYLQPDEDIVTASVATVALNEFAEVILAGTSVIPISYAFLGPEGIKGSIGLAFMALPNVFTTMAGGRIFGAVWFFLLFFAGFTSAIAMYNYLVALLEEDLNVPRKKGTIIIFIAYLIVGTPIDEVSQKLEYEVKPIIGKYVAQHEQLYNAFYTVFSDFATDDVNIVGRTKFLNQPEFSNVDKIKNIYEKLDDKETLREIQEDEDRNIKVYIGSESNIDEDVTVIKTTFKNNNNEESTLAIVGPKRMDYERVVSMLEFLKENIEKSD